METNKDIQALRDSDEPSEIEAVIACLGDDAARLQETEPEVADNMRAAERLLEALAAQVQQEREACAAIADSVNNHDNPMTARDVADAIRSRNSLTAPVAAAAQGDSVPVAAESNRDWLVQNMLKAAGPILSYARRYYDEAIATRHGDKMMFDYFERDPGEVEWIAFYDASSRLARDYRAASQDTVPTTVANQAINDALRLVSQDSERDAARYRWIRDNSKRQFDITFKTPSNDPSEVDETCRHTSTWDGPDNAFFDAMIDAAMAAQQGEKG